MCSIAVLEVEAGADLATAATPTTTLMRMAILLVLVVCRLVLKACSTAGTRATAIRVREVVLMSVLEVTSAIKAMLVVNTELKSMAMAKEVAAATTAVIRATTEGTVDQAPIQPMR
jgi:hypothetical protein